MGLFREIMRSNAPVLKYHSEFYGDEFNRFNSIEAPSPEMINKYQMKKLIEFQGQAFKNNSKTEYINNFLRLNGQLITSTNEYDKIVYEKMTNLFNQINQLIGKGYMSKQVRSSIAENKVLEENIITKLKMLGKSLNSLRKQSNMVINSSYITQLDNIIASLPNGDIDAVLRTLFHLKGDILEEIGTEWFNQRIPQDLNVKAFSTGSVRGKKGQQLIQDLIVVDMDNTDLLNTLISFKLGNSNYQLPLKDFFKKMEQNKGQETISIDSDGEELLQSISLLGIQAKSGLNQLPWNMGSKNTWASIQGDNNELGKYLDFLEHMNKLKRTWDNDNKNMKKESGVYRAMADYELARSISKVLHLSQTANQYVLTPNGFMPFVSRIIELYEKNSSSNYYFSFGGRIYLDGEENFLTKTRPVILSPR